MTSNNHRVRPSKSNPYDACFDVRSPEFMVLEPGQHFITLPFKTEFSKKYYLEFRPKSGLAKKYGFSIVNSPGTIDYGYKENVCLNFNITKKIIIAEGQKIAQMMLKKRCNEILVFVPKISQKGDRGGGHGSTGKF